MASGSDSRDHSDHGPDRSDAVPTAPSRFGLLNTEHAPGQSHDRGRGPAEIDFSHGDVAAFPPPPGTAETIARALADGGRWAYSSYRGHARTRNRLATRLADLTGAPIDPERELLISAGTQAGIFLALSAIVEHGDHVAVAAPDYLAYRKIVQYLGARICDVPLNYCDGATPGELDLDALRRAFAAGARVLAFSNPNNPTGVVYSGEHLADVCDVVSQFGGFVIIDQLYCRQVFEAPWMIVGDCGAPTGGGFRV